MCSITRSNVVKHKYTFLIMETFVRTILCVWELFLFASILCFKFLIEKKRVYCSGIVYSEGTSGNLVKSNKYWFTRIWRDKWSEERHVLSARCHFARIYLQLISSCFYYYNTKYATSWWSINRNRIRFWYNVGHNINWRDVQTKNVVNNVEMSCLRAPWQNGPYKN